MGNSIFGEKHIKAQTNNKKLKSQHNNTTTQQHNNTTTQHNTMVKAWAEDFVNEYETGFAHKIDWDAAKQVYGTTWFEEKRDEWTYRGGVRYCHADVHGAETYDVIFKKKKY